MSSFTSKTPFVSPPQSPESRGSSLGSSSDWDYANDVFVCCYDESIGRGMQAVQAGVERHLPPLLRSRHRAADGVTPGLDDQYTGYPSPSSANEDDGAASDHLLYSESDGNVSPLESRKRARSGAASSRHRLEVVTELGAEELRWFYKEDKKTWKPFAGHDSLNIELMYRKFCELNPVELDQDHNEDQHQDQEGASAALSEEGEHAAEVMDRVGTCGPGSAAGQVEEGASVEAPESAGESDVDVSISVEAVCVRGGLYQVDVREMECYPVYWNQQDRIPVMRGQWFIDGTWMPMEEDESDLIEREHLTSFRGQQMQDSFENDVVVKTVDTKDALSHFPPFYLPFLFKWSGYQTSAKSHKRKRCQAIHSLKLSRSHVDWHSVDEVYLYSDATTSKIARTVTQKLGFSKASSSGTRLHRGYVEEASLEDKPPQTTHIVFVVHGIGQKMDKDRIIKNTGMLREAVRKMEEKHFADHTEEHVEFLPVEWRSKLALDGDTVDSITPDKVRGLRDLLNSSAMDIMYYTSPLYRDEITKGLTQELNRLYALFCSRNPEFEEKGGKVSIISHSLGCVIAYDIMTGWDPVRFCLLEQQEPDEEEMRWMSYEERHLLEQVHLTRQRLRELEDKLQGLEASKPLQLPALKFKVENYFCMGSPLAVFLALRGIRPGSTGYQDHIMPKSICKRLFNIFHPTDPVAYRLEPLVLKHYSNIAPVQIHWCNTTSPTPYDEMKPTFLNPVKDPVSDTESLPSPSTSPVMNRRHYGESITNLGKASLLGAASIGKGIGGMLFSRFSRSSSQPSGVDSGVVETEEKSQSAYGLSTMSQSTSTIIDTAVEMEHRIDFELREGLVESRYWSAVTSHTAYWTSHDVALFLLTFIYKSQSSSPASEDSLDPE
ncbi:phospholipase DDHD1 isoform X1 [Astyanax mexicanus]|uniref:Phospholipase DDHD1 isoform X1 n=1 Tax=Astyanax mexicanus TaxID=7994 RepID=A0A8T2LIS2_ASTMX|nr:phospholipase DDHD1 isoform X1 [Astyanax mexicanus]